MSFMRLGSDGQGDSDRTELRLYLADRSLQIGAKHLLERADGSMLDFDGRWTDLHLDPFDADGPQGGGIWHASLSDSEIGFVFDMCVAAGFLVVNHQCDADSAMFVIPDDNHGVSELEELVPGGSHVFVSNAAEMQAALLGSFERFVEYRDRVIKPE